MTTENDTEGTREEIAKNWCTEMGAGWSFQGVIGNGGTATVFAIESPTGPAALKIYAKKFSTEIEQKRIDQQIELKSHSCPSLVQIYDGGKFQDRLFLLMERASGQELEKKLADIPRNKVRFVIDQVARAVQYLRERGLWHRDIKAANICISDDFNKVTLLDISVLRSNRDPLGIGTDQSGKLPVVGTTRYCPPEYLFRLLEPSEELWDALNIYQLGALLHDLIMQKPMFQEEYEQSSDNRYRFAWIVATVEPKVRSNDIDEDLNFLARRALDKDWKRRLSLKIEDFFADLKVQRNHALQVIGIGCPQSQSLENTSALLTRSLDLAQYIEDELRQYLHSSGVTATHRVDPGVTDTAKTVKLSWPSPRDSSTKFEFRLTVEVRSVGGSITILGSATLTQGDLKNSSTVTLDLPDIPDDDRASSTLRSNAISAMAHLAVEITKTRT